MFASNLRPLGIDVEVKPFELLTLIEKLDTRGSRGTSHGSPGGAAYPDPAGAFFPLLRGTRYEARFNAANRLADAARAKAWANLEADLMRNDPPVAVYADFTPPAFVSRRFGCWTGADFETSRPRGRLQEVGRRLAALLDEVDRLEAGRDDAELGEGVEPG